jgi:hypothetical protein
MIPFFRKLAWQARRRSKENELAAELRFHLEEDVDERQQAGVLEDEARWAARREFGNLGIVQEDARAAWIWPLVEQLAQDLRYAARMMMRNPAFTMLAVLSVALGIGANTAIYSFMDALLSRTLPVGDPGSPGGSRAWTGPQSWRELFRRALLLDRDDGAPASWRHAGAGAGSVRESRSSRRRRQGNNGESSEWSNSPHQRPSTDVRVPVCQRVTSRWPAGSRVRFPFPVRHVFTDSTDKHVVASAVHHR